ncbi:lipocalin family protein [Sphingobacterium hotanense]|uniref:Lipocalin family protein n=1 Tax=Sphingobacterium hotanense TaxID=649196 RepID=A0ABT7NTK7_9SPHI|nr:lipocalin family protein [Sphingobacterium hotanense]MDM1050576.1 lipocalin family protein [Sphingobacterium hotanense]
MDKKKSLIALSAVALGTVAYNLLRPVKSKVDVIEPFDLQKYLGRWYEIARFDFRWERNLKNVTADYSLNEDGSVLVNNQGINITTGKHKQSIGKAKFVDEENRGALKVSFFGPFYAGYNIVKLDENYQDALVFGDNLDYIWFLSRNKTMSKERKEAYLNYAQAHGYDTSKLVWTIQE